MTESIMGFTITKTYLHSPAQITKPDFKLFSSPLKQCSNPRPFGGLHQYQLLRLLQRKKNSWSKVNALPHWDVIEGIQHWPLMAVLVQHMEGQRDLITYKSIWHLSDRAIKNVYVFYMFFTCWGCLFFGSMKDPYYDSEEYRKDGGDGTGHWVYEKQEDIEETARAELWREELIEEIEEKVGGLRELEEVASK